MSDTDIIDNNPHIPNPFFYNLLRWILGIAAIFVAAYASVYFLVEMRSLFLKLSYKPLTEEAALKRAIPMKTVFPTTMQVMSGSDKKEIEIKAGTPIKFLGACMKLLNNRVDGKTDFHHPSYIMSPRVYTPSQLFLIETEDGIRGAAFLPEAIIGRKIEITKGDEMGQTFVVSGIKKIKSDDKYPYEFSVEGSDKTFKWDSFKQLTKDTEIVIYNNPFGGVSEEMQHKIARVPKFMPIPKHEQNGFFLFPRFKVWNMYYLKPFLRSLVVLILLWIILLVVALVCIGRRHISVEVDARTKFMEDTSLDNIDAQAKILWYYWPRYYPFAFICGCLFTPLIWIWTSMNHRDLRVSLRNDFSKRCPQCHHMSLEYGPTGNETEKRFVGHVHHRAHTDKKVTNEVYDEGAKQWRQDTVTTHYSAEDYDDYEYEKEMKLACTNCDFCEKHWEKAFAWKNHKGGDIIGQESVQWVKK